MIRLLLLAALSLAPALAFADEVEFTCDGDYKSKEPYSADDPSTVSVHAHLEVVMLGDETPKGYSVSKVKLEMKATNHHGEDAGTFSKHDTWAKDYDARDEKYKGHVRIALGSKSAPAYPDVGNTPETYVLLPWGENGSDGPAYVQRHGSGHDVYPTITLTCE